MRGRFLSCRERRGRVLPPERPLGGLRGPPRCQSGEEVPLRQAPVSSKPPTEPLRSPFQRINCAKEGVQHQRLTAGPQIPRTGPERLYYPSEYFRAKVAFRLPRRLRFVNFARSTRPCRQSPL